MGFKDGKKVEISRYRLMVEVGKVPALDVRQFLSYSIGNCDQMKTFKNRWKPIIFICLLVLVGGCIDNNSKDTSLNNNNEDFDDDKDQNPTDESYDDEDLSADDETVDDNIIEDLPDDEVEELIESEITLEIIVDGDDIRSYDRINYTVTNAPYGSNITWEMGDGTILYGEKVQHFYRSSDYYQINVTAIWDDEFSIGTRTVPVKNRDEDNYSLGYSSTRLILGSLGYSIGIVVEKGITIPDVYITIKLVNLTGRLEIGTSVVDGNDRENKKTYVIEQEEVEGINSDLSFDFIISKEELIQYEDIRPYSPSGFLYWAGLVGHVEFEVSFIVNF